MKNISKIICVTALIFPAQASIGCDYPSKISIPDGNTAAKEEMLEGVRAMKKWQEDLVVYRTCIEEETEAAKKAIETADPGKGLTQITALERQLNLKYNASIEDEQKKAANFNEQIKIFKSKN
jgi:hypothetical protein